MKDKNFIDLASVRASLEKDGRKRFWQTIEQVAETEEFQQLAHQEFTTFRPSRKTESGMSRRNNSFPGNPCSTPPRCLALKAAQSGCWLRAIWAAPPKSRAIPITPPAWAAQTRSRRLPCSICGTRTAPGQ